MKEQGRFCQETQNWTDALACLTLSFAYVHVYEVAYFFHCISLIWVCTVSLKT